MLESTRCIIHFFIRLKYMQKEIYLDHAATTYLIPEVLEAMNPYFFEIYGNPESLHNQGKKAQIAVDEARKTIAKILNCKAREIYFTNTATQANNLAIQGIAKRKEHEGKNFITSKIEHPSIREAFKDLEKQGKEVKYLDLDKNGFINTNQLEKLMDKNTILTSIIYAHNEIGTIQDIEKISTIFKKNDSLLHIDACQAANTETLDVQKLGIDLMTINSSKIYGPKGIAALYIKGNTAISPITFGGKQEKGLNPGTHNVAGIVGFAKALEIAQSHRKKESNRLKELSVFFINELKKQIPKLELNGIEFESNKRLANNINIRINGISGEELLLKLNEKNIYISTGSACNMGKGEASYTLEEIGLSKIEILSSVRISTGLKTNIEDLKYTIRQIKEIIEKKQKTQFKVL